jgi:6,7-dimethyl-8-ribityllumazine synthase
MSTEVTGIDGDLPSGKIVIVASRYNQRICDSLVRGALETLGRAGYPSTSTPVVRVPGAWELPTVVKQTIAHPNVIAAVALGCVIKGETTHDIYINRAVSQAIMTLSVETGIPVAFGLLTCNTLEQAIHRSGGNVGNKGIESAEAVLELLRLGKKIAHGL